MIDIIPFSENLADHVRRLNYEWLEKYFKLEASDIASLSNPQKYIIDKGGYIFYAKFNGEIIGTASLLKKENFVFELGKMAVTESMQGKGVGVLLLKYCIDFAKGKGIQKLILYSNTQLASAIHIYKKYGFIEIPLESGLYERANIKMEKVL
jgi:N-acetylglutamate synthase-like GNAT family acetyltransferase